MSSEQLIGAGKTTLLPCQPGDREAVRAFLMHFVPPIRESLNAGLQILRTNPTQEVKGTVQYRRNQLATLNWLLSVNEQRK
jgi:hypothetical protein